MWQSHSDNNCKLRRVCGAVLHVFQLCPALPLSALCAGHGAGWRNEATPRTVIAPPPTPYTGETGQRAGEKEKGRRPYLQTQEQWNAQKRFPPRRRCEIRLACWERAQARGRAESDNLEELAKGQGVVAKVAELLALRV